MNKILPINEVFHGTNNILYKHIYYIAVCNKDIDVSIKKDNLLQYEEIGDIGWFNYKDCCNLIRPYHKERKRILNETYIFSLNILDDENFLTKNSDDDIIESIYTTV